MYRVNNELFVDDKVVPRLRKWLQTIEHCRNFPRKLNGPPPLFVSGLFKVCLPLCTGAGGSGRRDAAAGRGGCNSDEPGCWQSQHGTCTVRFCTPITRLCHQRCDLVQSRWPPPMLVPGLHGCALLLASQTGKKFVLRRVLPALLAESPIFGVGKPDEAHVIKLDLAALPVCQVCGRTAAESGMELGNLRRVGGLQFGVGLSWAICWEACPQALYMVTCQEVATRQSQGGRIAWLCGRPVRSFARVFHLRCTQVSTHGRLV